VKSPTQAGKYLFRYRAAIAAVFFVVLVFYARPMPSVAPHIFIITGIALRLWAAGYIGPEARQREFSTERRIISRPYRIIKHPLYVGNFFLVLGVIILYNPPRWFGISYIIAFIIMYALIAISEKQYLKGKSQIKASYRFSNLKGEASTLIVVAAIYAMWILLAARG